MNLKENMVPREVDPQSPNFVNARHYYSERNETKFKSYPIQQEKTHFRKGGYRNLFFRRKSLEIKFVCGVCARGGARGGGHRPGTAGTVRAEYREGTPSSLHCNENIPCFFTLPF